MTNETEVCCSIYTVSRSMYEETHFNIKIPFFKVASNYTYAVDSHIEEEGGIRCDSKPINMT